MLRQDIPTYQDLLWPTLEVLEKKGGSASIEELSETVPELMRLPDEVRDIPHKDGPQSEVDYRAAWARTHLKMIGAVENTERGVWALTDHGRQMQSEEKVLVMVREARAAQRRGRRKETPPRRTGGQRSRDSEENEEELAWVKQLLDHLRSLDPAAFERLCQRLLRECGFTKVEITGRSGDGGIDGAGVLRVNLLSFHVRFQSKRYSGSVGASDIRDFRGAMVGRADKGLFITTGRFTTQAEREAVRDGAPAIDLIDGMRLCKLLKRLELGVKTETVERVSLAQDFFERL